MCLLKICSNSLLILCKLYIKFWFIFTTDELYEYSVSCLNCKLFLSFHIKVYFRNCYKNMKKCYLPGAIWKKKTEKNLYRKRVTFNELLHVKCRVKVCHHILQLWILCLFIHHVPLYAPTIFCQVVYVKSCLVDYNKTLNVWLLWS